MPNHVTTKITLTSPNAIEAFEFMQNGDNLFDLEKLAPKPAELDQCDSCVQELAVAFYFSERKTKPLAIEDMKEYTFLPMDILPERLDNLLKQYDAEGNSTQKTSQEYPLNLFNNPETLDDLYNLGQRIVACNLKYGAVSTLDWQRANWGTKWNTYHHYYDGTQPEVLTFDTAWDSPTPIIKAFMDKFELSGTVKAFDEGYCFWFIDTYENGVLVAERNNLEEDRDALALELKGYDPSDNDDEEE